jgi:hypothetical protein
MLDGFGCKEVGIRQLKIPAKLSNAIPANVWLIQEGDSYTPKQELQLSQ